MSEHLNKIPYPAREEELVQLFYHDIVYAWLLLHSHFSQEETHNYIYKKDFSCTSIGRSCHKNRNTVATHIKKLVNEGFLKDCGEYYTMPHFPRFQYLHDKTIFGLITLQLNKEILDGTISAYAYLWNLYDFEKQHTDNPVFRMSMTQLGKHLGLTMTHNSSYDKIRTIITILSGAGLIEYHVIDVHNTPLQLSTLEFTKVNWKAKEDWLKLIKGF